MALALALALALTPVARTALMVVATRAAQKVLLAWAALRARTATMTLVLWGADVVAVTAAEGEAVEMEKEKEAMEKEAVEMEKVVVEKEAVEMEMVEEAMEKVVVEKEAVEKEKAAVVMEKVVVEKAAVVMVESVPNDRHHRRRSIGRMASGRSRCTSSKRLMGSRAP